MRYDEPNIDIPSLLTLRALVVQREQNQVRKNLRKYNNFVKEKQIKVEDGNRVYHEEKDFQQSITHLLEEKREQAEALAETKVRPFFTFSFQGLEQFVGFRC